MAKARMTDLSDLLTTRKSSAPAADPAVPAETPAPAPRQETKKLGEESARTSSARAGRAKPAAPQVSATPATPAIPAGLPRYLTLIRKESRITQAQADQLSSLVRSLNMARRGEGERITDNTLIRVAIGLLLERAEELQGTTEAELFHSMGLDPME